MNAKSVLSGISNALYCGTADRLLFSSSEIREHVEIVMHIYPLGLLFLRHYMTGKGENLRVSTEGIIENDTGVKQNLRDMLSMLISTGIHFNIPNGQGVYNDTTYKMAFGSLNFQWKVVDITYGVTKNIYIIDIWFVNTYRWHEMATRFSQCMHRAYADSSGQEFKMFGKHAFYQLTVPHQGEEKELVFKKETTSFLKELRCRNLASAHEAVDIVVKYPESKKYFTTH